ncbi:MAG: CopG family transcriptional regulator [Actinomycetes bacterium]
MLAYVKRTTVKLPEDVDRAMRDEAARRGLTLSDWTREAIEAHLPVQQGRRRLRFVGAGRSGETDISERIDEILATEWPEAFDRNR